MILPLQLSFIQLQDVQSNLIVEASIGGTQLSIYPAHKLCCVEYLSCTAVSVEAMIMELKLAIICVFNLWHLTPFSWTFTVFYSQCHVVYTAFSPLVFIINKIYGLCIL